MPKSDGHIQERRQTQERRQGPRRGTPCEPPATNTRTPTTYHHHHRHHQHHDEHPRQVSRGRHHGQCECAATHSVTFDTQPATQPPSHSAVGDSKLFGDSGLAPHPHRQPTKPHNVTSTPPMFVDGVTRRWLSLCHHWMADRSIRMVCVRCAVGAANADLASCTTALATTTTDCVCPVADQDQTNLFACTTCPTKCQAAYDAV
jgi:hypothetical protein